LEIVEDHKGDTFRAIYTVRFAKAVYVLHAFLKKSPKGIETGSPTSLLLRSGSKQRNGIMTIDSEDQNEIGS
jgi:phage-related protein